MVILTSNRTREVHDALKRRCLYQWIEYPSFDSELAIVRVHSPEAPTHLTQLVTAVVMTNEGHSFDAEELTLHCRRRVPSYKVPRRWSVTADLPRTARGKIDRRTVALVVQNLGTS